MLGKDNQWVLCEHQVFFNSKYVPSRIHIHLVHNLFIESSVQDYLTRYFDYGHFLFFFFFVVRRNSFYIAYLQA